MWLVLAISLILLGSILATILVVVKCGSDLSPRKRHKNKNESGSSSEEDGNDRRAQRLQRRKASSMLQKKKKLQKKRQYGGAQVPSQAQQLPQQKEDDSETIVANALKYAYHPVCDPPTTAAVNTASIAPLPTPTSDSIEWHVCTTAGEIQDPQQRARKFPYQLMVTSYVTSPPS